MYEICTVISNELLIFKVFPLQSLTSVAELSVLMTDFAVLAEFSLLRHRDIDACLTKAGSSFRLLVSKQLGDNHSM